MAIATTKEFVVSEDVIEHVQCGVRKHLRQRQRRGVPATSLTLVDRIMAEHDLFPEPDRFWERIAAWYILALDRTEPRCRGFVASDFYEIIAAHIRNDERLEAIVNRRIPADIEARVQRDAYIACTAGILDYTTVDDSIVAHLNPQHTKL